MAPIERYHGGTYGEATVVPPAFPEVDENVLNDIAEGLMALGDHLDGELIPHHAHQRMQLSDWEGEAGRLAEAAATGVLGSYGDACKAAYAAARKVFRAESAVAQTKNDVNNTAAVIQKACEAYEHAATIMTAAGQAALISGETAKASAFFNSAALFHKMIDTTKTIGLAENIAAVAKCATSLAEDLGVPAGTPGADGKMPGPALPPPVTSPGNTGVPTAGQSPGGSAGSGGQGGVDGKPTMSADEKPAARPESAGVPDTSQGGVESKPGVTAVRPPQPQAADAKPRANQSGTDLKPGATAAETLMNPRADSPQNVGTPGPQNTPSTPAGGMNAAMGSPGSRPASPATTSTGSPSTSSASSAVSGSPSGTPGGPGSGQQGAGQQGTGQPTGQQGQGQQAPKNPFGQLPTQPLAAAANAVPLATPDPATQTGAGSGAPAAASGAATGTGGGGAAPVAQASASTAAAPTGTPAGAAPPAPLGPAPTPSPAAPVAQPGAGAGAPGGPGVAPMSTNQQQNAAAAAPIPVTAARAERDAMAAAARAGLVRKSAGDADVQFAERIAAALHAPPSIPAMAWNFVWAVGVTTNGEIIAANSYGVSFIPDGMCLPSQVIFVSADERVPAGQRGRWVREPFVALQAWCTFHEKTLKVVIGTEQEVQPFAGSLQTRVIPPEDIPTDGLMKGRTRLEVIAPEAAAKLAEWPDAQLHEALPPQPVQLVPPDPAAIGKAWMESIRPLMQTTGETYRTAHLEKLAAYGRLQESAALYRAYTAPYAADLRAAITDWVWWQQFSTIQGDAQLVELGA